jgi:iron complex outermembrane recepter protein
MRIAVVAAAVGLTCIGLCIADGAGAAARQQTHIAAQDLGSALIQLAKSRGLQVLYLSSTVRDLRTHGVDGDITTNEAFDQLLDGTGLTYRYLDANTVTVVPINWSTSNEGSGITSPFRDEPALRSPRLDVEGAPSDQHLAAQAPPSPAQQIPEPTGSEPGASLQEIIVTGSRIAAPNEVSTSPIQVVSSKDIQVYGKTDVSDILNLLPQNFTNDLGQDLGNGSSGLTTAGGVATADLRGLGPGRTLVLVDGRRLGVGSPNTAISQPAPDLDQIPAGLVDRVEVVTGGASAAYGSDAIAGVVNFIMKRNFQGFQIDGQYNEYLHDNHDTYLQTLATQFGVTPPTGLTQDGRQRSFDVLMGTNFADGNGNITAYLSYRHADPVPSSQRDYGACEVFPQFAANGSVNGLACQGSSNSNWFAPATGPNAGSVYSVYGKNFVPWGTVATTPPAEYNSQPYIYLTREDDRYNAAFLGHDDINDYLKPYVELFVMDDRTHQQIAPAALFKDANPLDPTGAGDYYINCSNPLLSAQEQNILCTPAQIASDRAHPGSVSAQVEIGRRNIEGGARDTDFEHINYRAVFGSKGEFADAWSYDVYGQYYYTSFYDSNQKYLNFQSITNALQVTGTAAHPVCIGGALGCVPYNIFSDGGVTPQQLAYLYELGTANGTSTEKTLHADVTGKLADYGITSPLAREGLAVNIGVEHRDDHVSLLPDSAEESGLLSGFGSAVAPIDNSISVAEEFVELRAPLIQDAPLANELLFDTGYRRSDYTTVGEQNTDKFEVQYAPIADYRIRASYDKAIRAPSVAEAFIPPIVGQVSVGQDPCAGPTPQLPLSECENTHVKPSQYGSIPQGVAGQLSAQTSGNPNLKPEQGSTYTLGVNFAPSQIPHLSGSVDYYHIQIKDEIGTYPYTIILSDCAATGNPVYCSQIVRQPFTGSLTGNSNAGGGYVIQKNYNLGTALNSGVDVQLDYRLELPPGLGHVSFDLSGTYLLHNDSEPYPGAPTYDCAGLFGAECETVNPRWHHVFRTTWDTAWDVSASVTWRFIGPVTEDNNTSQPLLHIATYGGYDYATPRIPGFNYIDLEVTWNVNKILQLRAGANNVLDKDPPLINTYAVAGGAANTYSVYDVFGRQLFAAFTAKF